MPKIRIIPEIGDVNELYYDNIKSPAKIFSCSCKQCRLTKNKRRNRKTKIFIRRMFNKKIRKSENDGKYFCHYWA